MNEAKFKRNTSDFQSIRETFGHRDGDEAKVWAQAGLIWLLQGPNQAAPFFLNSERTDFFEIGSDVPPGIDSTAKALRVAGGNVDDFRILVVHFICRNQE